MYISESSIRVFFSFFFFSIRINIMLYTPEYAARNVVFYSLLVKTNNAFFSCQRLLCFAVAFKGLVCKLAVEHQVRYTKRVDLPTDVAVQVVSLVLGGVVYPW